MIILITMMLMPFFVGSSYNEEEPLVSVFDSAFDNSIIYSSQAGYNIRNAGSQWRFNYYGTQIQIKVKPTAYATYPQFSHIVIVVNNSIWSVETFSDENYKTINLPTGIKTIQLIEGLLSKPSSTIIGTFITDIKLQASKFTKLTTGLVESKTVFLGDSITVGANATYPSYQGFAYLFRVENAENVGVLGYGFGKVKDFAEDSTKRDLVVSQIQSLLSNAITTKRVVIALGTNDFALDSTPSATLQAWYAALIDAIKAAIPNVQIYCVSPLLRSSDGALLDDYRAAIDVVCSTRADVTHIAGKNILNLSDLADGVHPTVAGHKKYKDALDAII